MALKTRLQLRQTQSLAVTPQLLQSIRLLQLTHLELERFLDDQIEQNPLLERIDESAADSSAATNNIPQGRDASTPLDQLAPMEAVSQTAMADTFDASMDNVYPDDNATGDRGEQSYAARDRDLPYGSAEAASGDYEDVIAGEPSLRDHVLEQLGFLIPHHTDQIIAHELVDALDERGYVDADMTDIATRLGTTQVHVLDVLSALQQCDPPGLFARNLAECLALQCRHAHRYDPAMATLLDNLDLLAKRDFKALRSLCGVDESDLLDMLSEIQHLDPHPGTAFAPSAVQSIIHDVSVSERADGTWHIELNPDTLPRVLVNRDYHATLSRSLVDQVEKTFIADAFSNANWLERSLEQRAQTILKVATEIVKQQDAFLVHGIRALKPMTMRMVADAIDMHESTVSRVASNKYMMTPRGLFELRYFFTVAIGGSTEAGENSDSHSSKAVRHLIREMIDAETAAKVLSDDAIVARLKADGVDIARRTVAKYREAMGVASSVQRRREKKARDMAAQ